MTGMTGSFLRMSVTVLSSSRLSFLRILAIHSPGLSIASGMSKKNGLLVPGLMVNSDNFPTDSVAEWKSSTSALVVFVSDDAILIIHFAEVSPGVSWMSAAMIPRLSGLASSAMLRNSIFWFSGVVFFVVHPSVMKMMRWFSELLLDMDERVD